MFHQRNCGIKELQIAYLNNKIRSPCAFLSSFCKSSGNFFAKRAHSKTPAENRMDWTFFFGGDEKFCPTKVLSDKVVRKLSQIDIF